MPRSSKKIVASKATIRAGRFDKTKKVRQTDAHHAFETSAKNGVEIIVDKQYPRQDNDFERLPAGTTVKGDSALISSRKIKKLPQIGKIFQIRTEGNVQALIYTENSGKGGRKH